MFFRRLHLLSFLVLLQSLPGVTIKSQKPDSRSFGIESHCGTSNHRQRHPLRSHRKIVPTTQRQLNHAPIPDHGAAHPHTPSPLLLFHHPGRKHNNPQPSLLRPPLLHQRPIQHDLQRNRLLLPMHLPQRRHHPRPCHPVSLPFGLLDNAVAPSRAG